MYLLPKRKLDDRNITILTMLNQQPAASITSNMIQLGAITIELIDPDLDLDDIADGTTYGRVLQTNLSTNALKIITAQSALLGLIPATNDTSDLGSATHLWRYLYTHDISLNTDITPVTTNASDLGSSSKEFALGYIKNAYHDTRLQIPVGTDMYD